MKHQQSKSRYGNRAIIFTLDIFVALSIFLIALTISIYYVSQTSENKLTQLQMATAASDLLAVMDNRNILHSLNPTLIESEMNTLTPVAYQMRILIRTQDNITVDVGGTAPLGSMVISGKRYFVVGNDYGEVAYWIWARQ